MTQTLLIAMYNQEMESVDISVRLVFFYYLQLDRKIVLEFFCPFCQPFGRNCLPLL